MELPSQRDTESRPPLVLPEIIVIPDTPEELFEPGYRHPTAKPVAVAEPDVERTVTTLDDRVGVAVHYARYAVGAAVLAMVCVGLYAVLSVVAASTVTIIAVISALVLVAFFVRRDRAAAADLLASAEATAGRPVRPRRATSAATGQVTAVPASGTASVATGQPSSTGLGAADSAQPFTDPTFAPVSPDGTAAPSVTGYDTYDEVTGSSVEWDGVTTPTTAPEGQSAVPMLDPITGAVLNPGSGGLIIPGAYGAFGGENLGYHADGAPTAGAYGIAAPGRGFTGEVQRFADPTAAPSYGTYGTGQARRSFPQAVAGRLTTTARSTLFGAGAATPTGTVGGIFAGGTPALSADALRSMQTRSTVRRSDFGAGDVGSGIGTGPCPLMYLTPAWIAAMRSGRYQQARGVLVQNPTRGGVCRPEGICARGLLYNTADPDGWFWRKGPTVWIGGLPRSSGGWDHVERDALNQLYRGTVWTAEHLNDHDGYTFGQIADWVESSCRV